MYKIIICLILFASFHASAKTDKWQFVDTKTNASFRGLSVVDDSVVWVSGSKGWVGKTKNGGRDWVWEQVKGYEQCDFRSLYAFNAMEAVIANAGSPAYVLRTDDGGATWKKVYENKDTEAFIDGIDVADGQKGMLYGDPINSHILLLRTYDGGRTWYEAPLKERPVMGKGEASFAASGTCIKYLDRKKVVIATGGSVSRLLLSKNNGKKWRSVATPILQGESSMGIFSFLLIGSKYWIIAGGDYKQEAVRKANLFYTGNGGRNWISPRVTTRGYRECVVVADDGVGKKGTATLLAVGPTGIDISLDGGINWMAFSDEKQYHVIKKARKGELIIMAGGGGKVAVLKGTLHEVPRNH